MRLRLLEDERREELDARVAAYLDEHPHATANEIAGELGGNGSLTGAGGSGSGL